MKIHPSLRLPCLLTSHSSLNCESWDGVVLHMRLISYFRKWKMNCYCKLALLSLLPTKANLALPFPQVKLISKREHNAFGRVWISAFFVETISEYRLRALCVSRPPVRWWHTIYQQSMPLSICFSRRRMCYSLKVCGTAEAVASLLLPPLVSCCVFVWVGGSAWKWGRDNWKKRQEKIPWWQVSDAGFTCWTVSPKFISN